MAASLGTSCRLVQRSFSHRTPRRNNGQIGVLDSFGLTRTRPIFFPRRCPLCGKKCRPRGLLDAVSRYAKSVSTSLSSFLPASSLVPPSVSSFGLLGVSSFPLILILFIAGPLRDEGTDLLRNSLSFCGVLDWEYCVLSVPPVLCGFAKTSLFLRKFALSWKASLMNP